MGGPGLPPGRPTLLFCPEVQTIAPANLARSQGYISGLEDARREVIVRGGIEHLAPGGRGRTVPAH
jgi:hypothetical protein